MSSIFRVMTVCTGNICRSPMAEIVLRQALETAGLGNQVEVDSTGISSEEQGNPIDRRARRVLVTYGYPSGDEHTARRVRADELADFDLVLPMTSHHARVLRRLAGQSTDVEQVVIPQSKGAAGQRPQIVMFRSFDPKAPVLENQQSEHLLDVEDPWYGGADDFEVCLREIEAAVPGIVAHIKRQLG